MQTVWAGHGDTARLIVLPGGDEEVLAGVRWGTPDHAGTPAYWSVRCHWPGHARPGFGCGAVPLIEEIGFCLLGGYSVTYEANLAAFHWLRANGVFDLGTDIDAERIRMLLSAPVPVQGRPRRYRFPSQRAIRIDAMRRRLREAPLRAASAIELRDALMTFDGIGPKTASWVVRNHLHSDEVAILDVHVLRACRLMGLFPEDISLPRDYAALEETFLNFAEAINVRSSVLDVVMWAETRRAAPR